MPLSCLSRRLETVAWSKNGDEKGKSEAGTGTFHEGKGRGVAARERAIGVGLPFSPSAQRDTSRPVKREPAACSVNIMRALCGRVYLFGEIQRQPGEPVGAFEPRPFAVIPGRGKARSRGHEPGQCTRCLSARDFSSCQQLSPLRAPYRS